MTGYLVKDKVCITGDPNTAGCTAPDQPFEFFEVIELPSNEHYQNRLFSGVLGLNVNKTNLEYRSITQFLKDTKQIDHMLVSVKMQD